MKSYNKLYEKIISFENLILAWQKARKGKTGKGYVIEFELELFCNLMALHYELKYESYKPKPLVSFILRDPKTRVISKSEFRDRIVHHAIVNILEPLFDKTFIYDSCANRIKKGNLFALQRFDYFKRKVSRNGLVAKNPFKDNNYVSGYCLKADIKHYFQEVDCDILIGIISKKIDDALVVELVRKILNNTASQLGGGGERPKGMPLGNLTSQFFANVYLNELDYFVKHKLRAKYYIRYVDDFVILHENKEQLNNWMAQINEFLSEKLKLELHKDKSKVVPLSRGIDFVGFRNFYYYKLVRKRNIRKMKHKIILFSKKESSYREIMSSFQGWNAYVIWADTLELRRGF